MKRILSIEQEKIVPCKYKSALSQNDRLQAKEFSCFDNTLSRGACAADIGISCVR